MNVVCIDFETLPIESGTSSTPEPIGVSIKFEGNLSCYYDFDDSSTLDVLINVIKNRNNLLVYHNAAFDVRVQSQNMGIPIPPTYRLYDTMIFQYLIDAREDSLGLKDLAQKYCGMPNTEQDELQKWLEAHHYNHYEIYKAPYELVKKYAEKDTDMTYALYLYQQRWLSNKGQEQKHYILQAFEREIKLLPVVIDMQMQGVSLTPDVTDIQDKLEVQFDDISERLRNYGSGQEPGTKAFFNALVANGHVDSGMFEYTAKGNVKFGRDVLHKYISDAALLDDLEMRSRLQKLLSTYVRPFARSYAEHNGKFYFWLSQTRGTDDFGTRTGRFSSNIQQIPKEPKDDRLPFVRSFIVAKPGYVLLKRDFCFTDDTEFLTDSGFKLFNDIDDSCKLAQWEDFNISYEKPLRRIDKNYSGELRHIYGRKSIDLIVTSDHDMLVCKMKDGEYLRTDKVKADKFSIGCNLGCRHIPNSGWYDNCEYLEEEKIILIAALQADGSVKKNGRYCVFKLNKQRKIDRLLWALDKLKHPYKRNYLEYSYDNGFEYIYLDLPEWVFNYVVGKDKTFTRRILSLSEELLEEVKFWDGTGNKYFTTNKINADLMQELCTIRSLASTITVSVSSGYTDTPKPLYTVSMRNLPTSELRKQKNTKLNTANTRVVCFETNTGTLVVRRNGRVVVTGNCGQELRVAAHYAEGGILQAYKDNPKLDVHSFVQETIKKAAGIDIGRTAIKTITFLKLYRGGARLLAEKFNMSFDAAAMFFKAYDEGLPEFVKLMRDVESMAERGELIRTWGGRYYLPEPPNKDGKTYYYKMGNVLIQGSSADMTKEAMNRYYYHPDRKGRLALTVHDELVVEVLEEYMHEEMAILRWSMDEIPGWDVPLASDGFYGYNYGELKEYEQLN